MHNILYRSFSLDTYSANMYLFKVSNRNTRKSYEIFSELTTKTQERRMVSLALILKIFHTFL